MPKNDFFSAKASEEAKRTQVRFAVKCRFAVTSLIADEEEASSFKSAK